MLPMTQGTQHVYSWVALSRTSTKAKQSPFVLTRTDQLRTQHPLDHFHQDPCIIPFDINKHVGRKKKTLRRTILKKTENISFMMYTITHLSHQICKMCTLVMLEKD